MPYYPQQTVFRVSFPWVHAAPLPDEKSPPETLLRRLLSTEDRLSSFLLLKVKAFLVGERGLSKIVFSNGIVECRCLLALPPAADGLQSLLPLGTRCTSS
ncbi:hypothetical protein N7447_006923 [Penicillium robsamsonii]|uniref:uncharacterized protein n=1 Tax=Penicillium robsamsonii TaxID=1792511 RepID=UPI00254938A7|nr:uncharacterized protein N7447_006923 [Penicillium robsamsonii]KAJ5824583.1 hypothetical protein N7447_006923 [Penicillium robsamsonii]